jgi:hypothetical protein
VTITPRIKTGFTWERSLRCARIFIEADISFGAATRFYFDTRFFFKRSNYGGGVFFPEPSDETRVLEHEARARRSPNFMAKETFTFCEVSIFERLRKIA